jgi:hypothetical protein
VDKAKGGLALITAGVVVLLLIAVVVLGVLGAVEGIRCGLR